MRRLTTRPLLLAGCVLAVVTGCSSDGIPPGTEIPAIADARTGTLLEDVRIDGHAEVLVPIRGVLIADDGDVVIGQPQNSEVRWFDESGVPIGRFGAEGQGPGEFEEILTIGWRADTLWVFDPVRQRTSFVLRGVGLVRTEAMPTELEVADQFEEPPAVARPILVAIGADGFQYVTFGFPVGVDQPSPFSGSWVIARMSPEGTLDRLVARAPRGTVSVTTATGIAQVPFPHRGFTAASPTADRFAGAYAPLEGPEAGTLAVTTWDAEGMEDWSRRYRVELRPLPRAVADRAIEARLGELLDPDLEDALREYRAPAHYPPLQNLLFGTDGTLWVGQDARDGERPYLALDSSGDMIGRVSVPGNGRIAAAGQGVIWVIEQDAQDVESLVRYVVEWP